MIVFGTDLDGVKSLLPFNCKQTTLTRNGEIFFYSLQRYWFLQRVYNSYFRKPNPEIKKFMEYLLEKGVRSVVISASNEAYRKELERWLMRIGYFGDLILKENFEEDSVEYKKRVVPANCDFYLDDKKEMVQAINDAGNGKCRAILYRGQTSRELLEEFFPVFV
ncbi:MAG: hypothetical protein AAB514_02645 [Patescibacteria group bacterium]